MKQFTKRAISMLLAILIVVTMIPTFAITAFADDETIVWKFDPSQTSATGNGSTFNKGSAYKIVDPSNNNSFIQGIFWNETDKNCNTDSSTYFHAEDASISGGTDSTTGFGSRKLYGNHWIFQYRYAYLAQGKNGDGNDVTDNNNCSVFALGNNGANVVNITSDGNVYINGGATPTAQIDRNKIICNDKADVRTAAFEFENGTLTFSIKGETLFTTTAINGTPDITNFFMGASKVTTAGGTMQYVGPANTGNLIHGMYLYKLIASVITPSESTAIKKSGTLTPQKRTLLTGSGSRLDGTNWNIVNDQEAGNTSAGIVKYDITDLSNTRANSASLSVTITANTNGDYQGLTFYWTTDYSKVESVLNDGEKPGAISDCIGSNLNANTKVASKYGFSVDNNKLCSLPQSNNTAGTYNLNIPKETLQKIIDTKSNVVYIVCMQSQAGGKGSASNGTSGDGWTDCKVNPTTISITYDCEVPDATAAEVATAFDAVPKKPTPKKSNTTEADDGSYSSSSLKDNDKMSSVLYTKGVSGSAYYSVRGKDNFWGGGLQYGDMTFLYDGSTTDLACPISLFHTSYKGTVWQNYNMAPCSYYINTTGLSLKKVWHGTSTTVGYQAGTGNTVNYVNSFTKSNPASLKDGKTNYYSNTLYVDPSSLDFTNTSIVTIGNQSWNIYSLDNGNTTNDSKFKATLTHNASIRVINYKPLVDIINSINNGTLQEYKNIKESDDHNYYTGSSTIQYLNVLKEICDFDPNSYFGKSTNNYDQCAQDISALIAKYNSAKDDLRLNTYKVTFIYNDGHTLEKKVKRFGTVTCPNDGSPEVVTTHNEDEHPNTHKVTRFYWGPADKSIVKDMEYSELSAVSYLEHTWVQGETVAPTCTEDGYTVYECSDCHDTKHDNIVPENGHTYRPNQGSAVAPSNYTNGETYDAEKDYKHAINCIISSSHTKKEESCNIGASWVVNGDTETSTCSTCNGYVTRPHIVGYDIVFKDVNGNVIATNPTLENEMPSTPNLLNYAYIDDEGHHSFSWNKEVVEATEATEYQMVENELVPHAYADNYTEITAPTCYAEGLEADPCTVSRDCTYRQTRPITKTAHTFGAWVYDEVQRKQYHTCTVEECQKVEYDDCSFEITENVAETCTADGHIVYTCSDCGGSYEEFPKALGHDLSENWLPNNNGTHRKECSRCDYVDAQDCVYATTFIAPTCTVDGYYSQKCTICGHDAETLTSFDLSYFPGSPKINTLNIEGNHKNTTKEYTLSVPAGTNVNSMELTFDINFHTGSSHHAGVYIYDASGNELFNNLNNSQTAFVSGKRTNNTFYNVKVTVPGTYARVVTNEYFDYDTDYIKFKDIKVNATFPAKGHTNVNDNNFSVDGLLGTHTCSVCHETTEHNLDLKRSGSNIVVSCTTCDFSQVLHTTASTVTVTENNMFDTDKFFTSHTADATNTTSKGLACFRRTDGKAVVVGNGDNYTYHDAQLNFNDYVVTVEGGKTYQFDFDASTTYGDVMLFYRNAAGTGYDNNYLNMRKSGTTVGTNTIEFTVPEGGKQLYIRIGTNSGAKNAYCVFSNFALHEKDDPNYRVFKNLPQGTAIDDLFDSINQHGTADFCSYIFKNSSISYTDGTVATGTTVNRNVNVVARPHDMYKEYRNGTVAHYYCTICGWHTEKIVAAPTMIYRESFDDAAIDGSTLKTGSAFGQNATVMGGNASVLAGFASNGKDGNGNSSDWRNNVLKINANNAQGLAGNSVTLDQNPLAKDEATKLSAKENGVTISFWRAFNTSDASTIKRNGADYKSIDDQWIEALSFNTKTDTQGLAAESKYYYFEINATGANSFNNGNVGGNGRYYHDFIYNPYDDTKHDAGIDNPCWVNITVSIDPDKGATFYYNGEPHKVSNPNQKLGYENDAAMAKDLLDYITSDSTVMSFAAGDPYNQTEKDLYLDDIRVYTGAMTQVEVNNMFTDQYADYNQERLAQGKDIVQNSAGHDPTAVTVYALPNGKTVGQEYIDYHNIDVTDKSQIIDINYYIFGTGMTIYKSHDNVHWTVVGDDYGRCGYQNQKLYGGEYTQAIKEQLDFANTGHNHAYDGAGYLQWAPHIMYNLNSDCWQYYGSTSSWGSSDSCIFTGNSQSIEGPYTNITTVFASCANYTGSSTPANAIDSCVYYGHNADGTINPDELYMLYGSWQPNYVMELNPTTGQNKYWNSADPYGTSYGGNEIANGYHYYGKIICAANSESEARNSGEGGFMIYEDGYYYFYISLGSNYGNYQQRVFRSEYPDRNFQVYNGEQATDTNATHHGMSYLSSYQLPAYDHIFTSVGHNSVYKAVNKNNEILTVDSTHARTFSNGAAMEDQALITRQSDLTGNISIQNMVAYTESKWQVAFPLQYNGYDTTVGNFTAEDIVGTYAGNNLMMAAAYNYARPETFTVTACDKDQVHFQIGDTKYTAALTYGKDYAGQDITYITGDEIEGVIAKQGNTFEFSFFNKTTLQHTWGYQTAKGDASTATHDKTTVVTSEAGVYTWTTTCSKCDLEETKVVDITAYNASVATAQVEIDNVAKYTKASRDELATYIKELDLTAESELTQDVVDGYNTALTTANNLVKNGGVLVIENYTVTFKVYDVRTDKYIDTKSEEVDYVEQWVDQPFDTVLELETAKTATKWMKGDHVIARSKQKIQHVVSGEATIIAYVATENTNVEQCTVTLMNRTGKTAGVMYVNKGASISLGAEKIGTMDVEKTAFYQVTGYKVEGSTVSIGADFTVTKDVTIQPVYTANPTITITLGSEGIRFADSSADVRAKDYRWDVKVNLVADEEVTWYVNDKAVAKGTEYSFRASASVTVTAVKDAKEEGSTTITYANYDSENRKVRVVASSYCSETLPVVEQGLLILTSTDGTTYTKQQVIDGNKKYKASSSVDGKKEQFSFTLNVGATSTVKAFSIVAYTTYANGTTYSEVVTFDVN